MIFSRLQKLRAQFDLLGIDAFLVTFQPHVRYLSGFSGSSGIGLLTKRSTYLITDGRYAQQIRHEVKGWKVFVTDQSLFDVLRRQNLLRHGWRIGFDGNTVTYNRLKELKKSFPRVKFHPKVDCIEQLAAIKDQHEIAKIKKAVAITDRVFLEILDLIKPGVRELDIAAEISYRQRKHGAEADAFETIVASGERSAFPHGRASAKKLSMGEIVTLDFGCVVEGYHSDMTRTLALGRPTAEVKKIYKVVLDAQQRAIDSARSGIKTKELDAVARCYIKEQGYEKYYRHSLGHGIGLQLHEPPRLSVLSKATLESGNVVTIEPGVYIPNIGGVRIEDDVVITNGSCLVLNQSSKEFIIL
ncbi:MAG: aminopeptidase P family protein [Ignavibacteriae bacterium]|nr:aminopeptidase P family protein [Ignavibacteriota bacterium]